MGRVCLKRELSEQFIAIRTGQGRPNAAVPRPIWICVLLSAENVLCAFKCWMEYIIGRAAALSDSMLIGGAWANMVPSDCWICRTKRVSAGAVFFGMEFQSEGRRWQRRTCRDQR